MLHKMNRWVLFLVGVFLLGACSRAEVGKGIGVKVVDRIEDASPFGPGREATAAGAGWDVFLVDADTPLGELTRTSAGWKKARTDEAGRTAFLDVEGRYHVLVDADRDGRIDKRRLNVPSGSEIEIEVTRLSDPQTGDNWFELYTDSSLYHPGEVIRGTLIGYLEAESDVSVEVWHAGADDVKLRDLALGSFAGEVSETVEVPVSDDFPLTPAGKTGDFLIVPRTMGYYFSGARFSVRALEVSPTIRNVSLQINGGATETTTRTVSLSFAGENVATLAFGEDPQALFGKVRYPFATQYSYELSPGAGRKTVHAVFFDIRGNYAGPVSAAIELNEPGSTAPLPVTNMSVVINDGAPATSSTNVVLSLSADNAASVAFGESATAAAAAPRFMMRPSYGYALSPTPGQKTMYAMFFDGAGQAYGPVTDSIRLDLAEPPPPPPSLLHVIENPPGTSDFVYGDPGAVKAGAEVRVYADYTLTVLLGSGMAASDGAFGPLDIKDGSVPGNVEQPGDYVYVVSIDGLGRRSAATRIVNDSTPPTLTADDIQGLWMPDSLGMSVGNVGDVLRVAYLPMGGGGAADVAGGEVDFSSMGGPGNAAMGLASGVYRAAFTVPATPPVDQDDLTVRMRLFDQAGNLSEWVSGTELYAIDNIVPPATTIHVFEGGNRAADALWDIPAFDIEGYALLISNAVSGDAIRTEYALDFAHRLENLTNCVWHELRVRSTDDAGNVSPYSEPVSAYVVLPPPVFDAWGGLATGPTGDVGVLRYSFEKVEHASGYEVHYALDAGAPYAFTSASGVTSPALHGPLPDILEKPFVTELQGLPLGSRFYLSARAADGACRSEYADEVSAAADARILSQSDGLAEGETMGGALAAADWDGDGLNDILVGSPGLRRVAVVDPVTGNREDDFGSGGFYAPSNYDIPGTPLASYLYAGNPVHVVGAPLFSAGHFLGGRVNVYDHAGGLIRSIDGLATGMHFGHSIAVIGDIDGDGVADVAVGGFGCAHGNCGGSPTSLPDEGPGIVNIYSGSDLAMGLPALIRTHIGYAYGDYFGVAVAGGIDISGDSVPDYAIGAPGAGLYPSPANVTFYDGATGQVLGSWRREELGTQAGAAIVPIADLDGDGLDDWIVGVPYRVSLLPLDGGIVAVSSGSFDTLWHLSGRMPNAGPGFGAVLASGGDVNGDGLADVIVGAPSTLQDYFYGAGSAYAVSATAAGGKFLYEMYGRDLDGALGYSVLLPGDLNSGGSDEWVVGAPGSGHGDRGAGRVYVITRD